MLRNRGGTGAERTVGNVTFDPNGASGDEQELRNTGSTHGSQPATAQSPYNMHNTQRQGTGANANGTELVVVRHTGDPAEVGIRGRHKTLVYCVLILLVTLSIVNIGMVVYLYDLLDMSVTGVGVLRISDEQVTVNGRVTLREGIVTDTFRSKSSSCEQLSTQPECARVSSCAWFAPSPNDPPQCVGYAVGEGLTIGATNAVNIAAGSSAQLVVGPTGVTAAAPLFEVNTASGTTLLIINETHCQFSAETTSFSSTAGVQVGGILETSSIVSPVASTDGLTLGSVTSNVRLQAGTDVVIEATRDVTIESPSVSVHADSTLTLSATDITLPRQARGTFPGVLCVCGTSSSAPGRLIVSTTDSCDDVATQC